MQHNRSGLLLTLLFILLRPGALPAQPAPTTKLDLSGDWRFDMDRDDAGVTANWFNKDLPDRIKLPGILQSQGYGDDITADTPWVAGLGIRGWKDKPQYQPYLKPGNVKVPFLSQPPRHYLGVAWYQRDIDIPADWKSKRIHLTLERPRWETSVWVDDRKIGSYNSLVAPHEYELGMIDPGKHRLSIRIDNRMILPYRPDGHSVSDALGATWNGIAGQIELSATSPVWIDNVQIFPNVEKKTALVKTDIGNMTGQSGAGTLTIGRKTVNLKWDANGGHDETEVALGDNAQPWDEFHPALQHLALHLTGDSADDQRDVTFGLREIKGNDKQLLLNGHEIDLRGTHFGGDFPLTGYPATDVESWKKIFQVCKDYGLNHMRFHSWCPPEAAFTAADELGFYLQPECGMWNPFNVGSPISKMLEDETARIMKAYGNHPSFVLLSPSNEPAGRWQAVLDPWTAEWHSKDPRRLYADNTGRSNLSATQPTYVVFPFRGNRGWFGKDYSSPMVQNLHVPILTHEVGQWCAYPDFDVIAKFIGYLRPGNYEIFRDSAAEHGVLDRDKDFAWASGKFQVACYKEEIEANLRTPGLSGYQLLDLHDYLGQGTALVGVTDAFWGPKSYVTGQEFRRFSGPTVPLARLYNHVLRTSDQFAVDVEMADYGPEPLKGVTPQWHIEDLQGKAVAQSTGTALDIPIGKNISLGHISTDLSKLPAPAEYRLVIGLAGTDAQNSWNFWLYPDAVDTAAPADVLVTSNWPAAAAKLADGGKVLFTPAPNSLDPTNNPPLNNVPVFWNRQMNPKTEAMLGLWVDTKHLAMAHFPTEAFCDWQWTDVVRGMNTINLNHAPPELRPIVEAIDDWNRNWRLGVVFECKVGTGRLVVSAVDVQNVEQKTVARQLRRSLLDYMAGESFQPKVSLIPEQAAALFPDRAPASAPSARPTPASTPSDINEGVNVAPRVR
jgi:hypothetical protein